MNLQEAHKELMKDPKFREEWYAPNCLGVEIRLLRKNAGLTQKQLAEKCGTKQEAISRFENGDYMPTLSWLHKVVRALHCYMVIDIRSEMKQLT